MPGRLWRGIGCAAAALVLLACGAACRADTVASLLGNFTINQFCELDVAGTEAEVHFVVIYGQLPALRELHAADTDGNGVTSQAERDAHAGALAPRFADDLELEVDGTRVPLQVRRWSSVLPTEQGGFSLRIDVDYTASLPARAGVRSIRFTNRNYANQMGWHEIVVHGAPGLGIFDTNAFSTSATGGLSEALKSLPDAGPLDERSVHLRVDPRGAATHTAALGPRPGGAPAAVDTPAIASAPASTPGMSETAWITQRTRQLIDSISAPDPDPGVMVGALLAALLLGAVHALSPGHGKTIVGAYLIGSRGTPRHALFLGFTVTVTHTVGVFLLGFATLYASRYIMPERLFPILSLISALLVLGMGVVLLVQRSGAARRAFRPGMAAAEFRVFEPVGAAAHPLVLAPSRLSPDGTMHSHGGGKMHSHLPPGAAGERVTWKSLLALGISGGLVPCPSAMVLLLAAIALNKTGFGMVLVLVFSVGLAITLTVVGLAFLYARNRFQAPGGSARWPLWLPVLSACAITFVGAMLCVGAVRSFG